jgi:hypothetical protein
MGIVTTPLKLINPRRPELAPVLAVARADTGSV